MRAHVLIFFCGGIAPLIRNVALDGSEGLTASPLAVLPKEKKPEPARTF